jgi:hypothetical protein
MESPMEAIAETIMVLREKAPLKPVVQAIEGGMM